MFGRNERWRAMVLNESVQMKLFSIISEYSNASAHSCGALMKPTQGKAINYADELPIDLAGCSPPGTGSVLKRAGPGTHKNLTKLTSTSGLINDMQIQSELGK